MRIPMIAGNWKMNTTLSQAVELVTAMKAGLDKVTGVDKVVCPPFISLSPIRKLLKGSTIKLGAQNVYFEEKGAYTGEISPLMLAGLCEFCIIGHSERRQYFNETGVIVNRKVSALLKVGLKPILCVGERLEENEAGKTQSVIAEQLESSLLNIDTINSVVIAYEPIWAIGTGKAATAAQASETISYIRHTIARLYSDESAQDTRILYGGSVTADNIAEFIGDKEIDGALVGGASLKAEQFLHIVKRTSEIKGT